MPLPLSVFLMLLIFHAGQRTASLQGETQTQPAMTITSHPFGTLEDGREVFLYKLTNGHGMSVSITNYGGIVTELWVPDKQGRSSDVVLGLDSLKHYLAGHPYFGAIVGRYANRIAKGKFSIEGAEYTLAKNNNGNHLHGGIRGFDKVLWSAQPVRDTASLTLKLTYASKDGEEGYPGTLSVSVDYRLTTSNELQISYRATTDKPTIVNLSHHSYFNLAGRGTILDHNMTINADRYTVVDEHLIPTGELRPVADTPMDFTKSFAIGKRIAQVPGGYDHNYVLNRTGTGMELAARVYDSSSNRMMEVWTTEPGLQLYSGNFLDGTIKGKNGEVYRRHAGFCLEAQHFPDSPNQRGFPSVVLKPGQIYEHTTVYKFTIAGPM